MAFSGDLEHLSIVDVIQLLHSSRKSGILQVHGHRGQISLAFNDGYLVGASHYEKEARIGNILVESGVINAETLNKALSIQAAAGNDRKQLIATLLENGLADRDAAYKGLSALIELAIVEILTWKRGTFTLVVENVLLRDEYRYLPSHLGEDIALPAEHVLMDALRIYDEKMRDGLLQMEEDPVEFAPSETSQPDDSVALSADDLGLGNLEQIKRKLPAFHEPIKDRTVNGLKESKNYNELLNEAAARFKKVTTLPEISLVLLETVAGFFPRAITLVVREKDMVAERSIGINTPHEKGPGPVLGFRIPVSSGYLFSFVLDKGMLFYGKSDDQALKEQLYPLIGIPRDPTVLLLPLKVNKRTVALIYADFGDQAAEDVPSVKLENCSELAGITAESILICKNRVTNST